MPLRGRIVIDHQRLPLPYGLCQFLGPCGNGLPEPQCCGTKFMLGLYTGKQLRAVEWLTHKISSSGTQAGQPVSSAGRGAHKDYRDLHGGWIGFEQLAGLQAVHARQLSVQKDQSRRPYLRGLFASLLAPCRLHHPISVVPLVNVAPAPPCSRLRHTGFLQPGKYQTEAYGKSIPRYK